MSYLVLARKYRPQTFDEVVGQAHVTQTLSNAIVMGRVPHAVLFSGPRGTGKTTVARILAKAMNCLEGPSKTPCNTCRSCVEITRGSSSDVFEIDGASNNSVDQVRELRENIKYMPSDSRFKIYIIDEVHMLSIAAFNALLKTLEEPPGHIMFMFATTEPQKIPLTILSRCQRHDFRRIDIESVSNHLELLCRRENVSIDRESLIAVAREAGGSMRDALSLLDQVISSFDGQMNHEQLIEALGIIDRRQLFDISQAVFKGDVPGVLEILDGIYDRGHDVKKLFSDILIHFRNMTIVKMAGDVEKVVDLPKNEIDVMRAQIREIPLTYLHQVLDFLMNAETSIWYSDHPKLALELVFIKLFQVKPALPIDVLIEKIERLTHGAPLPEDFKPVFQKQAADIPDAVRPEKSVSSGDPAPVMADNDPVPPDQQTEYDPVRTWDKLLKQIKAEAPALAASLSESGLGNISGTAVQIDVSGNAFNLNMVRREKSLAVLQKVCDSYFGKKMTLKINTKKSQQTLRAKNSEMKTLQQEALNHPLVSDALTIFNGQIVEVQQLKDA